MFDVEVKEWGNSYGLRISKKKAQQLGLKPGDKVNIDLVKKTAIQGFGMFRGARPFQREKEDDLREY